MSEAPTSDHDSDIGRRDIDTNVRDVDGRRRPILWKDTSVRSQLTVDHKLNQQFRYFRDEFISVAGRYGITLPLNMKEDASGRIFNFVQYGCAGFVFEILQSETLDTTMLKISLSLLIVTLSVLQNCLPANSSHDPEEDSGNSLHTWIRSSIAKLTEGGAVSSVISIILQTSLQDIQGLAICLLSHLVAMSREAATQLLQPQNSRISYQHGVDSFSPRSPDRDNKNSPKKTIPKLRRHNEFKQVVTTEKRPTCMSYLLTVCATFRNRLGVISNCADIITTVANTYPDGYFALQIAKTSTCHLTSSSARRPHYAHHRDLLEGGSNSNGAGSIDSINSSRVSGRGGFGQQQQQQSSGTSSGIGGEDVIGSAGESGGKQSHVDVIPWIGVKLLLKFMQRGHIFGLDHGKLSDEVGWGGRTASADANTNNDNSLNSSLDASSTDNHAEVKRIYLKVVTALCTLITKSHIVATFVIHLPGAESLLKIAAGSLAGHESVMLLLGRCRRALYDARKAEKEEFERSLHTTRPPVISAADISNKEESIPSAGRPGTLTANGGGSSAVGGHRGTHKLAGKLEHGLLPRNKDETTNNTTIQPPEILSRVATVPPIKSQTDIVFDSLGLDLGTAHKTTSIDNQYSFSSTDYEKDDNSMLSHDSKSVDWLLKYSIQKPQLPAIVTGVLNSVPESKLRSNGLLAALPGSISKHPKARKQNNRDAKRLKKGRMFVCR